MAVTKLDICNMALGFIGTRSIQSAELANAETTPVSSPTSPEAIQCVLYWDRTRRTVLQARPFPFAIHRVALTTKTMPEVYSGIWTRCYALPADALKILSIHAGTGEEREPFTCEQGEYLLCNVASAQCTYVADVTSLGLWDERFVMAMARGLAVLLGNALLKNNPQKTQELTALYEAALPKETWGPEGWAVAADSLRLNIYNQALGLVGAKPVTSLTENSDEAVQCAVYWDRARKSVLRDYPFPFSIRTAGLTSTTMPSVHGGSWTNAYTYPGAALRVLSVHKPAEIEDRQPFAVEYLDSGAKILCNLPTADVTYVTDVPDVTLWDEKFTTSMAFKLALLINGALNREAEDGGMKRVDALAKLYASSLPGEMWKEEQWAVFSNTAKLTVYNRALGFVGAKMVSSTAENTPEAVQCSLNWDSARRSVLRDWPFRFAVHRAALATAVMPSVYGGEWDACYQYPSDALRVLSIHDPDDREGRKPFSVEYLSDKAVILCNVEAAECTYVADVEDTDLWDEKFRTSMSYRLAMMICNALLPADKLQGKMQELSQLYVASLPGEAWKDERWMSGDDETRLRIYNMALGFLDARTISSTTENTPEAVACNIYWDSARMAALRDYPRNFAKRRFLLEEVEMPELYRRQWRHCYLVPENTLKIVRVHDGIDRNRRCFPFTVEGTDDGEIILCNIPNAQATCAVDVPDISKWDSLFIKAMAEMLAIMLYPKLKKRGRYEHQ